jgi:hypothetical protein
MTPGPPSLLSNEYRGGALSLGVKWPEREADHSQPLVPRLRMRGAIFPLPHTSSWRGD